MEGRVRGEIQVFRQSVKGLTKNQLHEEVQYLQCSRSGYFKSKQKGKRRSKSSGKFKIFLHN